jgi:hypothetical protein
LDEKITKSLVLHEIHKTLKTLQRKTKNPDHMRSITTALQQLDTLSKDFNKPFNGKDEEIYNFLRNNFNTVTGIKGILKKEITRNK